MSGLEHKALGGSPGAPCASVQDEIRPRGTGREGGEEKKVVMKLVKEILKSLFYRRRPKDCLLRLGERSESRQ